MNIVIVGKGMLGKDLAEVATQKGHNTVLLGRDEIDITRDVSDLTAYSADVLVNCAAFTKVDDAQTQKDLCYASNVLGVHNLTQFCKRQNVKLVTLSTDYVFGGDKSSYREDEARNPLNYYGVTKALGEKYVEEQLENYAIVRTAWLYGKHGINFVDTMRRLASQKEFLSVVNDQVGSPTYTVDLSHALVSLMEKDAIGTFHLTNSGSCSWFEFAQAILPGFDVRPCSSEDFVRPAKRPPFSILENTRLEPMRHWREALRDYLS